MANPNKTVAAFRARAGRDPKAVEAANARFEADPMTRDMRAFQAGDMTAEEFRRRWNPVAEGNAA
jgi:hypothetical protein